MSRAGRGNPITSALAALLVVVLALTPSMAAAQSEGDGARPVLLIAADGQFEPLHAALTAGGGRALHAFPPHAIIGEAVPTLAQSLLEAGLARHVAYDAVPAEVAATLSEAEAEAAAVWEHLLRPPPLAALGTADLEPPHNDAFLAPEAPDLSAQADDADLYQQSEFLIGRVAVNIIAIESTGAVDARTETWRRNELRAARGAVVSALDWWRSIEPRAGLEFVYGASHLAPVRVPYEPINRPQSDEHLWISAAMRALGFDHPSYVMAVRHYNLHTRLMYGADWAFTIFIVNSANNADGAFTDSYFGYAYLHGPFAVVTSDAGPYTAAGLAPLIAHEVGHVFGALDEYAGAAIPASTPSGYLGVPNGNSEMGGEGRPCIMLTLLPAYRDRQVCPFTAGQVGWRDSDGDGILDPVDTAVGLSLRVAEAAAGVSVSGSAWDVPAPSPLRPAISRNAIEGVRYRINGGPWRDAGRADQGWSSQEAWWAFSLPPAPAGEWTLEVEAVNSSGNRGSAERRLTPAAGAPPPSALVRAELAPAEGRSIAVSGTAETAGEMSITLVEHRIDDGEWQPLPVGRGRAVTFDFALNSLAPGPHRLSIRAWPDAVYAVSEEWQSSFTVQGPLGSGATHAYLPLVAVR